MTETKRKKKRHTPERKAELEAKSKAYTKQRIDYAAKLAMDTKRKLGDIPNGGFNGA